MRQLTFSAQGRADVAKITRDIIGNNGRIVADRVVDKMRNSLTNLTYFPDIGTKRGRLLPGLYSWPMPPYVAFYRVSDKHIEIVRIIHGHRRITRKLISQGE
jgi:toxin ParE1/3/4